MSSAYTEFRVKSRLTYIPETDIARCVNEREQCNVQVGKAEAMVRQCTEYVAMVSAKVAAGLRIGGVDLVAETDALDKAMEEYSNAKRALNKAILSAQETSALHCKVETFMATEEYARTSVYMREKMAQLEKEKKDALERANVAKEVMLTVDPRIKDILGSQICNLQTDQFGCPTDDGLPLSVGTLVGCPTSAMGGRTHAMPIYIAVVVVRAENKGQYCIAARTDVFAEQAIFVVGRCDLVMCERLMA
jgi:hypothetical protein